MALTENPTRTRPKWTAFVCGMANYLDGGVISAWGVVPVIYQQLGVIDGTQFGIVSGLLAFMVAVGAIVGGRLGDHFGRRKVFLVTIALIAVSLAGMMLADSFPMIVIATVGVGLGVGADMPVSLTTIAEHATDKNRGALLGLPGILVLIGIVVSSVLGGMFGNLGRTGANALLLHLLIVAVLVFFARLTIPESHSWLLARLERRNGLNTVRTSSNVGMLIRGKYAPAFLGLIVFQGLCGAALNGVGGFGSYLLVNVAGLDVASSALAPLPSLPIGLISALLFMKAVGGPRRFVYFVIAGVGLVVGGLIPLIFGLSLVSYAVSLCVLSMSAGFAGESIMRYWSQVSFPTLLRNTAQGTVIASGRIVGAVFAAFAPALIKIDSRLFFVVVTAFLALGVLTATVVFRRRDSHNEFEVEEESDLSAGIVEARIETLRG